MKCTLTMHFIQIVFGFHQDMCNLKYNKKLFLFCLSLCNANYSRYLYMFLQWKTNKYISVNQGVPTPPLMLKYGRTAFLIISSPKELYTHLEESPPVYIFNNKRFFSGEMTLLQARVEMYFRFVRKRCAADIEVNIIEVLEGRGMIGVNIIKDNQ